MHMRLINGLGWLELCDSRGPVDYRTKSPGGISSNRPEPTSDYTLDTMRYHFCEH